MSMDEVIRQQDKLCTNCGTIIFDSIKSEWRQSYYYRDIYSLFCSKKCAVEYCTSGIEKVKVV
uniref:Uncharacterized protein n=1 Tax=viral metagenome TaxID=1070528 RepID=A0A6M3L7L8_9ZZZZ